MLYPAVDAYSAIADNLTGGKNSVSAMVNNAIVSHCIYGKNIVGDAEKDESNLTNSQESCVYLTVRIYFCFNCEL